MGAANTQLALQPTLHEGLFVACVDYLIWLDASRDLPDPLGEDFRKWRSDLLPESQGAEAYDFVLSAVRQLDSRHVVAKVHGLQTLLRALRAYADVPSGRETFPPFVISS